MNMIQLVEAFNLFLNIACRLYVPSNNQIFALGSYVIQCEIVSN